MIAESSLTSAYVSQRAIYDERYLVGQYDRRSAVRVLTAEREALSNAVVRTLEANQSAGRFSLFDFGYGTGRVTNDWIEYQAREHLAEQGELRVVAYDVSSVGLQRGHQALLLAGYASAAPLAWAPESSTGYIAGSVRKEQAGLSITVVFVHGCEEDPPDVMRQLALRANDGDGYLLTTSWYSGLGHIPGERLRHEYFQQLSELTTPLGDIVLAMSATGDLTDLQPEWSQKLASGDIGNFPIEVPGDVVYDTELGQANFYHVFGTELNEHMNAITTAGQYWWLEGIRYPDEEFASQDEEQANYHKVRTANEEKHGRAWDADDYREFHTVAAFRSSKDPAEGRPGSGQMPRTSASALLLYG